LSFIAGIITPEQALGDEEREGFRRALGAMGPVLPWPIKTTSTPESVLAEAGFEHMWQGPRLLSTRSFEGVAAGVQCKELEGEDTALGHLAKVFLLEERPLGEAFDHFACALIDRGLGLCVVCTDPLGMGPLFYRIQGDRLLFSSHQRFVREAVGPDFKIDPQGVLQYLIIGHQIGDRTLLKGLHILPPGSLLRFGGEGWQQKRYADVIREAKRSPSIETAVDRVYHHLVARCRGYLTLSRRPMAGFLSGGWDSRLLIALLAGMGWMEMTYTTQQRLLYNGRIISEKRIAGEVAEGLHLENRFIFPRYRTPANRDLRACILDHATWFHDWAFTMMETLPYDRYVFVDGLLGDILLRGLYVSDSLALAMEQGDRDAAIRELHATYLKGFNTYTRGLGAWETALDRDFLKGFQEALLRDIHEEMDQISHEDFVTLFLLRNRSRRGISPMPLKIFGMKGSVVLPFCGTSFIETVLSLPLDYRRDRTLYEALLERVKPGLSLKVSTNTRDEMRLGPYLMDALEELTWHGRIAYGLKKRFPALKEKIQGFRRSLSAGGGPDWAEDVIRRPPLVFMDRLTPSLRRAFARGDRERLRPYRFFLERIMMLEAFFEGHWESERVE
jgi:hypothetical protein